MEDIHLHIGQVNLEKITETNYHLILIVEDDGELIILNDILKEKVKIFYQHEYNSNGFELFVIVLENGQKLYANLVVNENGKSIMRFINEKILSNLFVAYYNTQGVLIQSEQPHPVIF